MSGKMDEWQDGWLAGAVLKDICNVTSVNFSSSVLFTKQTIIARKHLNGYCL